jgi:thiol-disulfide isomerase/thioredoxin
MSPLLLAAFLTASAMPPRTYLNIGDPAPSLVTARWMKGEPVKAFSKGQVYVVEFWATWCTPCKENIPHLTELAKQYRGKASICGISIWESNQPGASDYLKKVDAFVKSQGPKMDYHVAADGPDGKIAASWMKAADEGGIPTTFVIGRDQRIAWIGHPAQLGPVLEQVVADKFDVAAARNRRANEVEVVRPIREAMEDKAYQKAIDLIEDFDRRKPEQSRMWDYDLLVALYHAKPDEAKAKSEQILRDAQGDIGAYRMIVSIFASQKDLSRDTYVYGKGICEKALAKEEMKYLFLAMKAEISSSLGNYADAVAAQTEAVAVAEKDPHAPKDFVEFMRKTLEKFKSKANGG